MCRLWDSKEIKRLDKSGIVGLYFLSNQGNNKQLTVPKARLFYFYLVLFKAMMLFLLQACALCLYGALGCLVIKLETKGLHYFVIALFNWSRCLWNLVYLTPFWLACDLCSLCDVWKLNEGLGRMSSALAAVSLLCSVILSFFIVLDYIRNNVARLALVSWLLGCNMVHGINASVWASNVDLRALVWCDLGTNLFQFSCPFSQVLDTHSYKACPRYHYRCARGMSMRRPLPWASFVFQELARYSQRVQK